VQNTVTRRPINFYARASPEDLERRASIRARGGPLASFRFEHPLRRTDGSGRNCRIEDLRGTIRQEGQRK
jgi:hypothetical protein